MLNPHFHAFGRNAPQGGILVKLLQLVPFSSAQFGCSKKCEGYEFQRKFCLPLTAVCVQFLQEHREFLEWHSFVTLWFPRGPQSTLEISGGIPLGSASHDCKTEYLTDEL